MLRVRYRDTSGSLTNTIAFDTIFLLYKTIWIITETIRRSWTNHWVAARDNNFLINYL